MASGLLVSGRDGGYSLGLEETELRLGLPGGDREPAKMPGKRGFQETLDLKLKLPTVDVNGCGDGVEMAAEKANKAVNQKKVLVAPVADPEKPPAPKAQVVGWPPVRSFRKNILSVQSSKGGGSKDDGENSGGPATAAFVKVSMDGAPYLRKVDVKMYRSYQELSMALEKMFSSFTSAGNCDTQLRDFMNESKLVDVLNGSEYVPTYEDKDGDWMLVGDVPWE